jgi:hypothetical protein
MYAINGRGVEAPDVEQWETIDIGVDHTGRVRRSPYMRLTWTKRVDNGYVDWFEFADQSVQLTTREPHSLHRFVTYPAIVQRLSSSQQHGVRMDVTATFLVLVG